MQIQLKHLKIVNLKGIKDFEASFDHVTNIYGANAAGKTTIFDAFLWLFFGKNSSGDSKFPVQRLDGNNKQIKNLNTEVSATLIIDGKEITVKKIQEQEWVTKKGSLELEYKGDVNSYTWDKVPMTQTLFKEKIAAIVKEDVFRMITNPYHFASLDQEKRRSTLITLAGTISDDEIFSSFEGSPQKEQFDLLRGALISGKTIEEYKREIGANKSKIKEDISGIPDRIDEVRRGMPDPIDVEGINKEIETHNTNLQNIDDQIGNLVSKQAEQNRLDAEVMRLHNKKVSDHQQLVFGLRTDIQNLEFDAKQKAKDQVGNTQSEIDSVTRQINEKTAEKGRYETGINQLQTDLAKLQSDKSSVITEYDTEEARTMEAFSDNSFSCPTCKQSLPAEDIESKKTELTENFNRTKLAKLEEIRNRGRRINTEIEAVNQRITNGSLTIAGIKTELDQLNDKLNGLNLVASSNTKSLEEITKDILDANPLYINKRAELDQKSTETFTEPTFEKKESNDEELKAQRKTISDKISDLRNELNKADQIAQSEKRITELTNQESSLSQQYAKLEGIEFAILQYNKVKFSVIQQRIDGMFKHIQFRMFKDLKNGGEEECCDALVNTNGSSAEFKHANKAGQINAGIDIINALSKHYDTYAPIFVDNRESVSELIESQSQIVNLIVSAADKTLRVA